MYSYPTGESLDGLITHNYAQQLFKLSRLLQAAGNGRRGRTTDAWPALAFYYW
eukprot:COSAG01_NODE_2965_length_6790_cov_68.350172_4_plen_53_part_00